MPDPNRRYGSFAQTGGGRWTAAFAHLLPARPERDLVVELRRHAVVATCLLTFCMLFGGARVVLPGIEEGPRAVVLRQMDLVAVALGTGLVLPLAGAQRAFDEDLRALRDEFLDDLAEALAEAHDGVPFGPLLAFTAAAVLPALAGSGARRPTASGRLSRSRGFALRRQRQ